GVEKVVYASSSSVYGDTPVLPKKEEMTPSPLSPYAVSKLVGEYYCRVFTEVYGLPAVSLRYFNVYGPWQDPSSEYAAVIPNFISRVLNCKSPIVFGDGKQTRDFTFVRDVVNANTFAVKGKTCGVFNIASGKRISINELAQLVIKMTSKDIDVVYEDSRPGDIMHSLADISKAKEKFGYESKFDLKEGLEETLKWFRK
ncbi:GDP-mannose 4,6-dehydratase, partial [bacterium]|nr:GDP-mannose 4,6-dehydratase [bacterium]